MSLSLKSRFFISFLLLSFLTNAQDDITSYKTPPKDIMDLVLAKPTPSVSINDKAEWMLLMERSEFPDNRRTGTTGIKDCRAEN